jgi:2-polyprenyl-3-methyl-5-hydroxy-6-metoxy-1,4-benzoquinol methylase
MNVEEFFKLFMDELRQNENLHPYYKFLSKTSDFEFRKAYFCQRLQYIYDHIDDKKAKIWDCGCGYGTTAIFLSLNGISTYGSTLEFYYKEIPQRLEYWKQFGNVSLFSYSYEDVFDTEQTTASIYDIIILQDTLHHIEPLNKALKIFNKVLKPSGKIILIEENGSNIIQNAKLFLRRGCKKVITLHDEKLKKDILIGNENIRSLKQWKKYLEEETFKVIDDQTQYIRFFPPFSLNTINFKEQINKEQILWKKYPLLRDYFFFGLNFIVKKQN